MARLKIGAALLCAGLSSRFNGNKLLYPFFGEPLAERCARVFPKNEFHSAVAVVSDEAVQKIMSTYGYNIVVNPRPQDGQSSSIKLALSELRDTDACMFCMCDQPLLSPGTIQKMTRNYSGGAMGLKYFDKCSSPTIVPKECYGALFELERDETGKRAITKTCTKLNFFNAECAAELEDADTRAAMENLLQIKNVFLTGHKNIGKSSILSKALNDTAISAGGFITVPNGSKSSHSGYRLHALSETLPKNENDVPISSSDLKHSKVPVTETFETSGVKCLRHSRERTNLIVMDELGTLENEAEKFKTEVRNCLNSKVPVFGIIQDADTAFLNEIKCRPDTRVLRVNGFYKQYAYDELIKTIKYLM